MVSILSNWSGKERESLISNISPNYLLNKIEDEDASIILRLLDCMKIILTKDTIKAKQQDYIEQIILLLSHKDFPVKNKALETLTLTQNISEFIEYLVEEKFTMEKIMSCFKSKDVCKKSILNLLLIILSNSNDDIMKLITDSKIEQVIDEQLKNLNLKLKDDTCNQNNECEPEFQILNLLNQVKTMVEGIKQEENLKMISSSI